MCKQPAKKPVQALVSTSVRRSFPPTAAPLDLAAAWKLAKAGGATMGLSKSATTAEISMIVPADNVCKKHKDSDKAVTFECKVHKETIL